MQTVIQAAPAGKTRERAAELFRDQQMAIFRRTDRMFAGLLVFQWFLGILFALWVSPRTWSGQYSQIHIHLIAAVLVGGLLISLPLFMALRMPGRSSTRQVIACAQMLYSALLIHLSGGRIETHFHIFGSLAFLAFYRDWRVLVTATVVVAADHWIRGVYWPQSVFGILQAAPWRWMEHAAWVVFEDVFLILSIGQNRAGMMGLAERQANLEAVNASVETKVSERTAELSAEVAARRRTEEALRQNEQRMRVVMEQIPAILWTTDTNLLFTSSTGGALASIGRRANEDTGKSILAYHNESDPAIPAHRRALRGESAGYEMETRERSFQCHVEPLRDGNGAVVGCIGVALDNTEHLAAEAELRGAHLRLVEASRQAGMAEVATGVLHNVGNVLNSVNVSVTLVFDSIRKSKADSLARIAALMKERASGLGEFLTQDEKGKRVPAFIEQLAAHLVEERDACLAEMEQLRKSVAHIKEIVEMQQGYAKVSGVSESVKITGLVEDAVRLNTESLRKHAVTLSRQYEADATLFLDKHKVLQIIVNLIHNAARACVDSGRTDRQVIVRVVRSDGHVRIMVDDNGVGIPPENLTRIFHHGFTTRNDGHGFGLHSGALAAKELGGSLHASSRGPGSGAVFTLELPVSRDANTGPARPHGEP